MEDRKKGNKVYARIEDTKKIEEQIVELANEVHTFFTNEWPHHVKDSKGVQGKVEWMHGKIHWILGVLSILGILVAGLIILIVEKIAWP